LHSPTNCSNGPTVPSIRLIPRTWPIEYYSHSHLFLKPWNSRN
jgi:hypothetical protein